MTTVPSPLKLFDKKAFSFIVPIGDLKNDFNVEHEFKPLKFEL